MYGVRFGDAVLVSVPDVDEGGQPLTRHILFDVGNVLGGEGGQDAVFQPVIEDVLHELAGAPLDLYVMTHEHRVHVQGLSYASERLGLSFPVEHAWLTASAVLAAALLLSASRGGILVAALCCLPLAWSQLPRRGRWWWAGLGAVVIEIHLALPALLGAEKDVAGDGEEPAANVGTGLEGHPAAEGAQVGLLHDILGVRFVAGEGTGKSIDVVERGQCEGTERLVRGGVEGGGFGHHRNVVQIGGGRKGS
jgi:hypothetical protein